MIEKPEQKIDTEPTHRRRGNAFDTLAHVLRSVKELWFRGQLVARNRPSEIANSNNVFEMYVTEDPKEKENYMFIGRSGVITNTDTRNLNYIEVTADSDTTKTGLNNKNGIILLMLSKSKVVDTFAQISIGNGNVYIADKTGTVAVMNSEGDGTSSDLGLSQVAYKNTTSGAIKAFYVDKNGFNFEGLPSSSSGLPAGAIYRDGTTLKIVT
jgi:hypothetical protein